MRRIPGPVLLVAGAVAWMTTRERNPARWPGMIRRDVDGLVRDAREALVDGARAGVRAEQAFDHDLDEARTRARTW